MLSFRKRDIQRLLLAALAGALLSACGGPAAAPQPTATVQPTAAPQPPAPVPTVAAQATAAPAPTSAPAPIASPAPAAAPELYYADQNALYAQPIGGQPRRVADIAGTALDVALAGDTLLVLRAEGLDRIALPAGASTTLVKFDSPARAGSRLLAARDQKIFYAAVVDDPSAVFGKTLVGYYDAQAGATKPLLTADGTAQPIGLTPTGDGLYLLPRGQDPAFGRVQVIDLASGKLRAELPVEGEAVASASPDGRYIVTTARRYSASDPNAEPESLLYLYDLSVQPLKPREITPPKAPSAAANPFWSPDSRAFYFALGSGNIYELKDSYGVWRYVVATNEAAQVSDVDIRNTWFSPLDAGGATLVRPTTQASAQLVDLATGKLTPFALPPNALVAGWR